MMIKIQKVNQMNISIKHTQGIYLNKNSILMNFKTKKAKINYNIKKQIFKKFKRNIIEFVMDLMT